MRDTVGLRACSPRGSSPTSMAGRVDLGSRVRLGIDRSDPVAPSPAHEGDQEPSEGGPSPAVARPLPAREPRGRRPTWLREPRPLLQVGGTARGLGTKGLGSGSSGFGSGGGTFGKKGGASAAVGGDPVILGALDRSLIDEVIKRHMNQIKYCYQRELTLDPALRGKLVVKYTIAKDGSVSSASLKTTTMNNPKVEECVVGRFLRMRFPPPNGGGIVLVSYPFLFAPKAPE